MNEDKKQHLEKLLKKFYMAGLRSGELKERERSKKLLELLEDIHFKLPEYVSHEKIADVIKEYRGEK